MIGAAIADITGNPWNNLIGGDSNPGKSTISAGGVARNIAENLSRLGIQVQLLSAFGNDYFGRMLIEDCNKLNINIENSLYLDSLNTANYLSINNPDGNLNVAVSDTSIIDTITPDFIRSKAKILSSFDHLILDTNLSFETLEYILENYSSRKIFLDTVSMSKAPKIINRLKQIHILKTNFSEACILASVDPESSVNLDMIRQRMLSNGANRVFITLGKKGCYYFDRDQYGMINGANVPVVNASGAGDAFTAGLVYSNLHQFDLIHSAQFSMAASVVTLKHHKAVNPDISLDIINQTIQKHFHHVQ